MHRQLVLKHQLNMGQHMGASRLVIFPPFMESQLEGVPILPHCIHNTTGVREDGKTAPRASPPTLAPSAEVASLSPTGTLLE